MRVLLRIMALATGLAVGLGTGPVWAAHDPLAEPPRVLVVASDPGTAAVADLAALFDGRAEVTVIAPEAWEPGIDIHSHDGIVYFATCYFTEPPDAMVNDLASADLPVLWIGYHGWKIAAADQARLGLAFSDDHRMDFTGLRYFGLRPLFATDSSAVTVSAPARVEAWLHGAALATTQPAIARSGDFTYVSYFPALMPHRPDYAPFGAALDGFVAALGSRAAPPAYPDRITAARADPFRTAIHLPYIWVGADQPSTPPYDAPAIHANLVRIHELGAEFVVLTRTYFQDGIRGSEIFAESPATATEAALANAAADAHRLGLAVQLSVVINLTEESRGPNDWRGMILPEDGAGWWAAYRAIILEAARFARDHEVEALTIGNELSALERFEGEWRALARAVRQEAGYAGLIGYQVNFDRAPGFAWGDALDYLGVAAYWPLATSRDPGLDTLAEAWAGIGAQLAHWAAGAPGVRLEFGEIGYASQPYAAVFPFSWKPNRPGHLSLTEQETCYLALEAFLTAHPEIAGVGVFASLPDDTRADNIGYSPFGKPAEAVVRRLMELR